MKRLMVALLVLGCDAGGEGRGPVASGIYLPGTSTGADEGTSTTTGEASTSAPAETTGEPGTTSTGLAPGTSTGDTTTGAEESTGDGSTGTSSGTTGEATSSGEADTSTSSGTSTGEDTSTGSTTGDVEPPCPCTAEVQAGQNVCAQEPTPTCPATMPGGLCDPDGNGAFDDADWIEGFYAYMAACA